MERFTIKKSTSEVPQWVCIDHESNLVCIFEDKNFCGKKVFTSSSGRKRPDYLILCELEKLMANWIRDNHPDKF